MKNPIPALILALLLSGFAGGKLAAREIMISDPSQLGRILKALPGDVVVLKNGTWKDANVQISQGGTADNPVVIKAETGGGVILSGSSSIVIDAPYVIIDGLSFQAGAIAKGAVIVFKSDHGIVRNTAILDYNPSDYRTAYNWVLFTGSNNRLELCYFKGKNNLHAVVENGEPNARYNVVSRCYFKDIPLRAKVNGREIVKVLGAGHVDAASSDGAYFTLEESLFEHADGEGVEVVSLKSNFNRVVHNTVIASIGSLNIRRGSYNEIKNNVILGQGVEKAQGIRMAGEHNLIEENFIAGCAYGIAVSSGEYWAAALTPTYKINDRDGSAPNKARYPQNKNVIIIHNTLVGNIGPDLDIGVEEYKKHWPENQNVLIPEECRIENNLCVRPLGGVSVIGMKPDTTPPLDRFSFKPNTYAGNLLYGGSNRLSGITAGFEEKAVPPDWSEAKAIAAAHPLRPDEVGPSWLQGNSPPRPISINPASTTK